MFTGIVAEIGEVAGIEATPSGARLTIGCRSIVAGLEPGDSVAVNGVCLSAVAVSDSDFSVEAVRETLDRTNLGALRRGSAVDLERPLSAGGSFDGHLVQGHVDAVGTVTDVTHEGGARRVRIAAPGPLMRYIVEKGSITVDGVSLTVTGAAPATTDRGWFEVVLIPLTLEGTVLGGRAPGDEVNLEVDVLAKYVERALEAYR